MKEWVLVLFLIKELVTPKPIPFRKNSKKDQNEWSNEFDRFTSNLFFLVLIFCKKIRKIQT